MLMLIVFRVRRLSVVSLSSHSHLPLSSQLYVYLLPIASSYVLRMYNIQSRTPYYLYVENV
jgi:hypothetical protein